MLKEVGNENKEVTGMYNQTRKLLDAEQDKRAKMNKFKLENKKLREVVKQ